MIKLLKAVKQICLHLELYSANLFYLWMSPACYFGVLRKFNHAYFRLKFWGLIQVQVKKNRAKKRKETKLWIDTALHRLSSALPRCFCLFLFLSAQSRGVLPFFQLDLIKVWGEGVGIRYSCCWCKVWVNEAHFLLQKWILQFLQICLVYNTWYVCVILKIHTKSTVKQKYILSKYFFMSDMDARNKSTRLKSDFYIRRGPQ